MVIPTTYPSLRDPEVYPNPDTFDPERWISGDAEVKGAKNWLVFGTGPHYCLGQVFAQLNLALLLGKASMHVDWKHHATPTSEDIKVFATIFPQVIKIISFENKISILMFHRMTAPSPSPRDQHEMSSVRNPSYFP